MAALFLPHALSAHTAQFSNRNEFSSFQSLSTNPLCLTPHVVATHQSRSVSLIRSSATATALTPSAIRDSELAPLDENFFRMGYLRRVRAFGVEFKEGPQGVGVYSSLDIPLMTLPRIVMEIPVELMVTVSQDEPWIFRPDFLPIGHPLFDVINSTNPESEWDIRMACMVLLAVHQSDNFWHLYSDYLPPIEECSSLLLANQEELAFLQDDELAADVVKEQSRLETFWAHHFASPSTPKKVRQLCESSRKFLWAVAMARTRTNLFHCSFGSLRQDTHLIAPYADMLNHSETATCFLRWQKHEQRLQVLLKPGQDIRKGQELTFSYIPEANNRQLMQTYGFSKTGNTWERLDLSQAGAKIHLETFLSTFSICGPPEEYSFDFDVNEIDAGSLRTSGWLIAAARSLPAWQDPDSPPLPLTEMLAARELQEECRVQLQKFPTSLEEDKELLANFGELKSQRWRSALKYRMDKKDLYHTTIEALESYSNSFF